MHAKWRKGRTRDMYHLKTLDVLITVARGLGPYAAAEVRALGYDVIEETPTTVALTCAPSDVMRLNLMLRSAHRVLVRVHQVSNMADADDLYKAIRALPWETFINPDGYLSVTSTVENDSIRNPLFVNVKVKDAIVDRFRELKGRRPDSGSEVARGVVVHIYWKGMDCSIYIDTSGEALSKRNYRKMPFKAPMIETLAASIVLQTGWGHAGNAFVNPMCGSGTLAIEAALIALNRPAGQLRETFGFMHLKGFDAAPWRAMRDEARRASNKTLPPGARIIATDIAPEAIEAARQNARTAGVEQLIEFKVTAFEDTEVPQGGGVVVMNPEYGQRMGDIEGLAGVYKLMGDFMKQRCAGYTGYIFTGNLELAKKVGLRASRRIQMYNGPIECRLLKYELYAGARD